MNSLYSGYAWDMPELRRLQNVCRTCLFLLFRYRNRYWFHRTINSFRQLLSS